MSFYDIVQITKGTSAFIHLVIFALQGILILMNLKFFSSNLFFSLLKSKHGTPLSQMPFVIPTHSHNFH